MPLTARSKFALVTLLLGSSVAPIAAWAGEAVLVYQGNNLWVAEADNAPLRQVLKAAKQGTTQFKVGLPKTNRALSKARLGVLVGLLEKQRGQSIFLFEALTAPNQNSLHLKW